MTSGHSHHSPHAHLKNRVPHIIFLYWVIKIASTTLGETGADMFSMTFNLGYRTTILIFMAIFLGLVIYKLSLKKYNPTAYWLTFTASAIAGTAISDFIDRTLKMGYTGGAVVLTALLLLVLAVWYKKEKSVHVEYITTGPAEMFYWSAFLLANTLGTAAGDFMADDLGLGFVHAAMILTILLMVIAFLHYTTKISGTLLFWLAFVLTRPFGATFGDFLTKPHAQGGLDLGTMGSSAVFTVILFFAVAKESEREKKRWAIPK